MNGGPRSIETWERLIADGASLLEAVRDVDPDLSVITRLRKSWDAELVAAAIELARARRKALRKFPHPERLIADAAGVEVASSHAVAAHKAARFAACLGPSPDASPEGRPAEPAAERDNGVLVADLCCGIGGDAMALARVTDVVAIDRDPLRAWMAGRNAGCMTVAADVADATVTIAEATAFHLDPSRRDATGRRRRYADYQPGPDFIDALLARCPDGAVKLGPGIAFEDLPTDGPREVELITERGTIVQAVLWCGRLARQPGARTATRLPDGVSLTAHPGPLPVGAPGNVGRFLVLLDPALERAQIGAGVCEEHELHEVHPGLGVLTTDEHADSPWLTSYAVSTHLPWRSKRVKTWLTEHDAGVVTVKTRDRAIPDTDVAQKSLRGPGDTPYTVFGLRLGEKIVAIITRPCHAAG